MVSWWTEPHGDWLGTVTIMVFCGLALTIAMTLNTIQERAERRELEQKRSATAAPESH